jgi:predicted enzyme related to lactoylglutathione lyase
MPILLKAAVVALLLGASGIAVAAPACAQETGITVRSVRVLAADVEAMAKFYSAAFGMSETRRPVDTAAFKEIVLNSGSTPELAKKATSTPIVIATRRNDPPAGGLAALILKVPDMDKAIERATKAGAKLMRPVARSAEGLSYAFLTDPEGNQVELLLK